MRKTTNSKEETQEMGAQLAKSLSGGEMVLLFGDLGAGKTTFVQGMARALGIKKPVTSPTFSLMNVYEAKAVAKSLIHIDCYRLSGLAELEDIGANEHFFDPGSIMAVEWPERIENDLAPGDGKVIRVRFYLRKEENERVIEIIRD